eukprot:jgi/Tetstr1/436426/TSEL_025256.t1
MMAPWAAVRSALLCCRGAPPSAVPSAASIFASALPSAPSLGAAAPRAIWNDASQGQANGTPAAPTGAGQQPHSFYDSTVQEYALMPIKMLEFGLTVRKDRSQRLRSARYVQRELPRRLARRLMDLQLLPYIVVTNPHIRRVYDAYYHAFQTLRLQQPVLDEAQNADFTRLLKRLVDEHAPMLDSLAHGLRECASKPIIGGRLKLDGFFDNMLRSRISRRVLAEQHIQLSRPSLDHIGVIATQLSMYDTVDFAAQRTRQVCTETYGRSPEVIVSGDVRAVMPYIPMHLDYMLYELLKNASRAVMECHLRSTRKGRSLPPVQVALCEGEGDMTIRISDRGGGISDADMERVWQYGYTTSSSVDESAKQEEGLGFGHQLSNAADAGRRRYRMAGLGFGLPLSRVYARYFGGDLALKALPGYGVDAYLTLKRLQDHDWKEQLDEYSGDHVLTEPPPSA